MARVESIVARFCAATTQHHITTATARTGTWIAGEIVRAGVNSIELSLFQIIKGYVDRDGRQHVGTNANRSTVQKSIQELLDLGLIQRTEGSVRKGGYPSYCYSIRDLAA